MSEVFGLYGVGEGKSLIVVEFVLLLLVICGDVM